MGYVALYRRLLAERSTLAEVRTLAPVFTYNVPIGAGGPGKVVDAIYWAMGVSEHQLKLPVRISSHHANHELTSLVHHSCGKFQTRTPAVTNLWITKRSTNSYQSYVAGINCNEAYGS